MRLAVCEVMKLRTLEGCYCDDEAGVPVSISLRDASDEIRWSELGRSIIVLLI